MREARAQGPIARNALGALLLAGSWIFFTAEIITVRLLSGDLSIAQIALVRILTQFAVLLPWMVRGQGAAWRTRRVPMLFFRTCCSCSGMVLYYVTFSLLPVALATTLTFSQAMFLTIMAAVFLRERVGIRRASATAIGFLGVIVVMRPGFEAFDPGMLVALVCAVAGALVMLTTRSLGRSESTLTIMCWVSLFSTLFLIGPALWTWRPIEAEHWRLLAIVGGCGTLGQFMMVSAFRFGEASALAPVDYVRLVFAAVGGYLIFAEVPDIWTWAGSGIIITSALYITHREQQLARSRAASGSMP